MVETREIRKNGDFLRGNSKNGEGSGEISENGDRDARIQAGLGKNRLKNSRRAPFYGGFGKTKPGNVISTQFPF